MNENTFIYDKDYYVTESDLQNGFADFLFDILINGLGTQNTPTPDDFPAANDMRNSLKHFNMFGGLQLGASILDNKKFENLDLIGVELAKDPKSYSVSRLKKNINANHLASVASTATYDFLKKNKINVKDTVVCNPVALLRMFSSFNELEGGLKSDWCCTFIVNHNDDEAISLRNTYAYNLVDVPVFNPEQYSLSKSRYDFWQYIRKIKNFKAIATNSALIYEIAAMVGTYPILITTENNDVEYPVTAFCKDFCIPLTFCSKQNLARDMSAYIKNDWNGTVNNKVEQVGDYNLRWLPVETYRKSKTHIENFFRSIPVEWYRFLESDLIRSNVQFTSQIQLYRQIEPEFVSDLKRDIYLPNLYKIENKKVFVESDILDLNNVVKNVIPAKNIAQRLNYIFEDKTYQDYYNNDGCVTDKSKFEVYGDSYILYTTQVKSKLHNVSYYVINFLFNMLSGSSSILNNGLSSVYTNTYNASIYQDSLGSQINKTVLFSPLFIKNPNKAYSATRLANILSGKIFKSFLIENDKKYLIDKGILKSDVSNITSILSLLSVPTMSSGLKSMSAPLDESISKLFILSNETYKKQFSILKAYQEESENESGEIIISGAKYINANCFEQDFGNYIYYLFNANKIFTDDPQTYLLCRFLKLEVYQYNITGSYNNTDWVFRKTDKIFGLMSPVFSYNAIINKQENIDEMWHTYWTREFNNISFDDPVLQMFTVLYANDYKDLWLEIWDPLSSNRSKITVTYGISDTNAQSLFAKQKAELLSYYQNAADNIKSSYYHYEGDSWTNSGYQSDGNYMACIQMIDYIRKFEWSQFKIATPAAKGLDYFVKNSKFKSLNGTIEMQIYNKLLGEGKIQGVDADCGLQNGASRAVLKSVSLSNVTSVGNSEYNLGESVGVHITYEDIRTSFIQLS